MKKFIILLCCIIPLLAGAQNNKGINFQNFGSWSEVLSKAKSKHRNIFIDAYATWCAPCKKMDAEVYPDSTIGDYINANFISVKIQIDQTDKDLEQTKKWYKDAVLLTEKYQISAFPTFIFVDENGDLLYKAIGYQNIDRFIAILKTANDHSKSYADQIRRFKLGGLKGKQLLQTALLAKEYGDDSLAKKIASSYKKTFLDKTEPSKIINSDLLDFFANFYDLMSIKDSVVDYMNHHLKLSDSLLGNSGYSKRLISYLITKDLIEPVVKSDRQYTKSLPNWNQLENNITKSYDSDIVHNEIIEAKIGWYEANKNWDNLVKYHIEKIDRMGIAQMEDLLYLNSIVYSVIFRYSNNPIFLKKGVEYMELVVKSNPERQEVLDTYANILYKAGQKNEALKYEEKALVIAKEKNDQESVIFFKDIIEKIKSNQPTWPNLN